VRSLYFRLTRAKTVGKFAPCRITFVWQVPDETWSSQLTAGRRDDQLEFMKHTFDVTKDRSRQR
jgi:hypothetical protein